MQTRIAVVADFNLLLLVISGSIRMFQPIKWSNKLKTLL